MLMTRNLKISCERADSTLPVAEAGLAPAFVAAANLAAAADAATAAAVPAAVPAAVAFEPLRLVVLVVDAPEGASVAATYLAAAAEAAMAAALADPAEQVYIQTTIAACCTEYAEQRSSTCSFAVL